jgi:hypothetical protein
MAVKHGSSQHYSSRCYNSISGHQDNMQQFSSCFVLHMQFSYKKILLNSIYNTVETFFEHTYWVSIASLCWSFMFWLCALASTAIFKDDFCKQPDSSDYSFSKPFFHVMSRSLVRVKMVWRQNFDWENIGVRILYLLFLCIEIHAISLIG